MRTEDFRDTVDNDENGLVLVLSSCSSVLLMSISTGLLTILYIRVSRVVNVDIDQVVDYFVHQRQSCC